VKRWRPTYSWSVLALQPHQHCICRRRRSCSRSSACRAVLFDGSLNTVCASTFSSRREPVSRSSECPEHLGSSASPASSAITVWRCRPARRNAVDVLLGLHRDDFIDLDPSGWGSRIVIMPAGGEPGAAGGESDGDCGEAKRLIVDLRRRDAMFLLSDAIAAGRCNFLRGLHWEVGGVQDQASA